MLQPVFNVPSNRGRKHVKDLRTGVDARLYMRRPAASGAT
jgi:hypothetical protein